MKLITGYTGESHVTGADDAAFQNAIVGGDKVLAGDGAFDYSNLSATSVTIGIGEAVLHGVHVRCLANEVVNLPLGEDGKNRIDLLVIRHSVNPDTLIENAEFAIVRGTSSSGTATVPSLTKTNTTYEMALYKIGWRGTTISSFDYVATTIDTLDVLTSSADSLQASVETNTANIAVNASSISAINTALAPIGTIKYKANTDGMTSIVPVNNTVATIDITKGTWIIIAYAGPNGICTIGGVTGYTQTGDAIVKWTKIANTWTVKATENQTVYLTQSGGIVQGAYLQAVRIK